MRMRDLKYASLAMAVSALVLLFWFMFRPATEQIKKGNDAIGGTGEMVRAQGFHYTEYFEGNIVYQMNGESIHDEHAHLAGLRISAIKVVIVRYPEVTFLREGAGKGWVITANEGKIFSGRKKLTLSGNVHGRYIQGGDFFANKAVVDVKRGKVQLKEGYEIKTRWRKERGTLTTL